MDFNRLCLKCMKQKAAFGDLCPHCGFLETEDIQDNTYLDYWTILKGKYLVGKSLGQGGFGITYVGFDMSLEMKVAIKEYFPYGYAFRNHKVSSQIQMNDDAGILTKEKNRFLEEARILAQCNELPGIVKVRDFFQENNTCYIVMEYLEGETLLEYMKRNQEKLSASFVLSMMKPTIKSMIQIHEKGVIHKDISPDNIMITTSNHIKLIDFGAADRGSDKENAYTTYKNRYSPLEQRDEDAIVGTYSDIYAFCATMYYAMTGIPPADVLERVIEDTLVPPSQLGVEISPVQEAALMKGLEINPEDRIQDAKDLYYFLYQFDQVEEKSDSLSREIGKKKTDELLTKVKQKDKKRKMQLLQVILIVAIVAMFGIHLFLSGLSSNAKKETPDVSKLQASFLQEVLLDSEKTKTEDETLSAMAQTFADVLEDADAKSGWDNVYNDAIEEVRKKFPAENCAWMVIPVTEDLSVEEILEMGLRNENNANAFSESTKIGVAVVYHSSGNTFYIVFMDE